MENRSLIEQVKARAQSWLEGHYDEETKNEIRNMLTGDEETLIDAFYKDLEFGTGGLRGIMGAGTNRMNIYTVGMATQGLSNYIKKTFEGNKKIKIAIAHDCRNNSRLFAETAAGIFSANGFHVYLFEDLRPTPELSFAVRHLGCQSGIIITASHNPKEYNGYKVYWEDGAQIITPHDKNIIREVKNIKDIREVAFNGPKENIEMIGKSVDEAYLKMVISMQLNANAVRRQRDMGIVYTPIHGTGVHLVPEALHRFGFKNIIRVPEQEINDGNFPTVKSPNPEEHAALQLAIDKAKETGAELVLGTDPDGDRVGIAVKDHDGTFVLFNGNQTATVLLYYLLRQWKAGKKLKGREFIVKTIVTTEILSIMAEHFGVKHYDVLTGFKYIADMIRKKEGKETFIAGGEESYGYLVGDFVRDKDAVTSSCMIAETAAWARDQGKNLIGLLREIYLEFGYYKEQLVTMVQKGKEGAEEIRRIMDDLRHNPPETINGANVMLVHDYLKQQTIDQISHLRYQIDLPQSNVLQFVLHDGSKISVRPSGTEPKIKFYISVNTKVDRPEDYQEAGKLLEERIKMIRKDLKI
ncbi:MAG: phospho-sugar mutase [Chlorobi bacterium]|nr:phospho-sugar mutase [Chlorobiota bacterium]